MFRVTNKMKEIRKFRDGFTGRDVYVGPGEKVFTKTPIKASDVWNVSIVEKTDSKEVNKNKLKTEALNNDSSSSR